MEFIVVETSAPPCSLTVHEYRNAVARSSDLLPARCLVDAESWVLHLKYVTYVKFDPRQRRKDFSSGLCVQAGSGAHPASCKMDTGGPFPGAKTQPGRDADHSAPI
jgi:hypothetical protein